jgi:hypothetical protein
MLIELFIVCAIFYVIYKTELNIIIPQIILQCFGYTITATHSLYASIAIISLFCFLLGTRRVLRWPIFLFCISFILVELFTYYYDILFVYLNQYLFDQQH